MSEVFHDRKYGQGLQRMDSTDYAPAANRQARLIHVPRFPGCRRGTWPRWQRPLPPTKPVRPHPTPWSMNEAPDALAILKKGGWVVVYPPALYQLNVRDLPFD